MIRVRSHGFGQPRGTFRVEQRPVVCIDMGGGPRKGHRFGLHFGDHHLIVRRVLHHLRLVSNDGRPCVERRVDHHQEHGWTSAT